MPRIRTEDGHTNRYTRRMSRIRRMLGSARRRFSELREEMTLYERGYLQGTLAAAGSYYSIGLKALAQKAARSAWRTHS